MSVVSLISAGVAAFLLALALTLWSDVGAAVFLERAASGIFHCL